MLKVEMHAGTKLDVTNTVAEDIEKALSTISEVETVNVTVGSSSETSGVGGALTRLTSNQSEISVKLKKKRKIKSVDVVQIVKNRLAAMDLSGARIDYVLSENVLSTGAEIQAGVTVEIQGPKLEVLDKLTRDIQNGLGRIEGVYGAKNDLAEPSPESKVFIDKDIASLRGLSVTDIAQTALIGLKGVVATKFKEKGREFNVRVRLREQDRNDFDKLGRLQIQSPLGLSVPLSSVAKFGRGKGPSEIKRSNQQRVVHVYANAYNRPIKDVEADVLTLISRVNAPKDYVVKLAGQTEEMQASFISMRNAIIAAFLLVYMVMAALFESLWQPFIIMLTIPLSLIGVAWALLITHTSISAYVLMGVGVLGGIVVNNAIVLMDCINLFISKGMKPREAAIAASKIRLRPIMMTALATILGLLPMACLGGEGAELRAPMAITTMGGLFIATLLTLNVVPAIYIVSAEAQERMFKKKKKEPGPA
jgi:HAE1 family hydrophobic/amphiphilic exporter-1